MRRRPAANHPHQQGQQHNGNVSDAGGQRAACIYTLVETAKMNGINPQAYLTDILGRIAEHPIHQIDALLPWFWTQ